MQDEEVKKLCQGNPPAKCFTDRTGSFSTNEIDIYWNSVAVYVGAYLCGNSE
jgi:endoglucanase